MDDGTHQAPGTPATPGTQDPHAEAIADFWEVARGHAGIGELAMVTGSGPGLATPPPAWSFGDNPGLADELLSLVLDGTKTATSSAAESYEHDGVPMPAVGDLSILLDGGGWPRALIRTTSVEVVPFAEVPADLAAAEGEDDRSLDSWRREHEVYFRRVLEGTGVEFGPALPVVTERFEVVYQVPRP